MYEVMSKTAITMELIKPYGLFHISFVVIGLLLSIFISYKCRKLDIKKLNRIVFCIGLFLLISEVYKQLFYTFYIGEGHYQYWIFPFQLCSIPLYLCLILPFIKNKNIYKSMVIFLISYNLLGGFISFAEPSGLIHEYLFLTWHAFLWHMSLVLLGLLLVFNNNIKLKLKDFQYAFILFLVLCVIAFIINLILWVPANGDINMFFIGPRISPIVVFTTIATKFGWFINSMIYIILLSLGAYLTCYLMIKVKNIML